MKCCGAIIANKKFLFIEFTKHWFKWYLEKTIILLLFSNNKMFEIIIFLIKALIILLIQNRAIDIPRNHHYKYISYMMCYYNQLIFYGVIREKV